MKISDELLAFFEHWLANKDTNVLMCRFGLCLNSREFNRTCLELDKLFIKDQLHILHPFNEQFSEYISESNASKCHLNAARINWVKAKIEEAYNERK